MPMRRVTGAMDMIVMRVIMVMVMAVVMPILGAMRLIGPAPGGVVAPGFVEIAGAGEVLGNEHLGRRSPGHLAP